MEFIDPVHGGLVPFSNTESRILGNRLLRRLGLIKQIGLSWLAFPGAHHSVLEHVIGTLYLAKRNIGRLSREGAKIDTRHQELFLMAVLLSRVQVEPLRHIFWDMEARVENCEIHDSIFARKLIVRHKVNKILQDLWGSEYKENLDAVLSLAFRDAAKKKRKKKLAGEMAYLIPLIQGTPLTFNWLDNIPRDAYYAGIGAANFDTQEIFSSCEIATREGYEGECIIVGEKAVAHIESMIVARINQYLNLYSNPYVISPQKMVCKAILLLFGKDCERIIEFREQVVQDELTDEEMLLRLEHCCLSNGKSEGQYLIRRVLDGVPYRCIENICRWPDMSEATQRWCKNLASSFDEQERLEQDVASELGVEPYRLIIDFDLPKSAIKNIDGIRIRREDGSERTLLETSKILRQDDSVPEDSKSNVYGPFKVNWFLGVYYDSSSSISDNAIISAIEKKAGVILTGGAE